MDPLARNVVARYAATIQRLDLAWVEKLRKDFLTLLKNLPRVKDYATAHELKTACRIYATNFETLFFENFLNKDLKYNLGLSESDVAWINHKLRSVAWDLSSDLRDMPIGHADDYWSEERRFAAFEREFPKWKVRVQRKGQIFWKAMKEFIDWFEKVHKKPLDVSVPTVENATIEGFKLIMKGYEPDNEYNAKELNVFKEGLRLYRQRASKVAPILLQKQVPVFAEFKTTLDKGGEYHQDGTITFYMSSIISKGVPWVAHVMAHEMGHHLWRSYLSKEAQEFWEQTIKGDYGDLDVQELLDKWPGTSWAFEFSEVMGDQDPILALQVEAISHDRAYGDIQKKEDFQKLLDQGHKTLRVPKTPISGYANKNPEEAFCETIGLLIAHGPRAVPEKVRWWLDTALPGAVKVAKKLPVA